MTNLEQKLIELGYEKSIYYCICDFYSKQDIRIYVNDTCNEVFKENCCVVLERKNLKNRNDIQELKDSIDYYHEQLMIMQKDLEMLRNVKD